METENHKTELIYQMAYYSVASQPITRDLMQAIVKTSQDNNYQNEITGLLLADTTIFVQWIEGPENAVEFLYNKIKKDCRHHSVTELMSGSFQIDRVFSEWSFRSESRANIISILSEAQGSKAVEKNPWSPEGTTLSILLEGGYKHYMDTVPDTLLVWSQGN